MSRTHRGSALVAALALGALALGASPAAAQATIDPDVPASLSVHKFEQPESATGLPSDGRELGAAELAGLTPIEGVEFSIVQVPGIDLTTNDGWSLAADLTLDAAQAAVEGSARTSGETDADGLVTFGSLPLGLYYVEETKTPAGARAAAPFLVTLPLTNPTTLDDWLYDVHVYPKNVITTAGKTVEDEGAKVGDTITWTITGDIPVGGRTDAYRVVDPLDSRLEHVATTVSLTDGTQVVEGTHYTVTHVPATNTVTVDFTEAGLDLLAAHETAQVEVVIDTVVLETGEIENVASIFPNLPSIDEGNPVVTPPVASKFGAVTVQKTDEDGASLAGAQFQVFTSLADAESGTDPVTLGGVSTWTSAADGLLTISGLGYSNIVDGVEIADPADWVHYYLVEVAAPAGFELLAEPVAFDVTSDDTEVDLVVENTPSNGGFELPMTGAQGVTTLVAAGVLLLVGSVVLALRSRAGRQDHSA